MEKLLAASVAAKPIPVACAFHSPLVRGERLRMSARAMVRKRRAVACYDSQLRGPTPVVPPGMLVRLLRPFEVLVRPYDPAA